MCHLDGATAGSVGTNAPEQSSLHFGYVVAPSLKSLGKQNKTKQQQKKKPKKKHKTITTQAPAYSKAKCVGQHILPMYQRLSGNLIPFNFMKEYEDKCSVRGGKRKERK